MALFNNTANSHSYIPLVICKLEHTVMKTNNKCIKKSTNRKLHKHFCITRFHSLLYMHSNIENKGHTGQNQGKILTDFTSCAKYLSLDCFSIKILGHTNKSGKTDALHLIACFKLHLGDLALTVQHSLAVRLWNSHKMWSIVSTTWSRIWFFIYYFKLSFDGTYKSHRKHAVNIVA